MYDNTKRSSTGYRVNEQIINVQTVRLIDEKGNNQGEVSIGHALHAAESAGLDLVETVATATPPVVKVIDYKKFMFETQKEKKEKAKQQRLSSAKVHETNFRLSTAENDLQTKLRQVRKWLADGDHVKISVVIRGRELARPNDALKRLSDLLSKVETPVRPYTLPSKVEGKAVSVTIIPA